MYTKDKALIFVWVDDLIMVADSDLTESTDNTILTHFEGRDLGEVSWILGLEVVRDRSKRSETMTQRRLIHDMLERFGLSNATQVSTPIDPSQVVDSHPHAKAVRKLRAQLEHPDLPLDQRESIENEISHLLTDGEVLGEEDKKGYMQIVGAVQYLDIVTRVDIAYASGSLARFMCKPEYTLSAEVRRAPLALPERHSRLWSAP